MIRSLRIIVFVRFQVVVGKRPVTGMRFFLEGMKCNKLALHLQHLSNTPSMLESLVDDTPIWRGSEEVAACDAYFEGIQGKKFSHVCVAHIEYLPPLRRTLPTS